MTKNDRRHRAPSHLAAPPATAGKLRLRLRRGKQDRPPATARAVAVPGWHTLVLPFAFPPVSAFLCVLCVLCVEGCAVCLLPFPSLRFSLRSLRPLR